MTQDDFTLSEEEAIAVAETVTAFAQALPPGRQHHYEALAEAATGGTIAAELVKPLERVCSVALESGKARQLGKAETERLLTTVYRRTPAGQALAAETADVNRTLAQLAGRTLQSVRILGQTPGRYQLDLVVDGIDITIAIEPRGLHVRSLQTSG